MVLPLLHLLAYYDELRMGIEEEEALNIFGTTDIQWRATARFEMFYQQERYTRWKQNNHQIDNNLGDRLSK